MPIIVIEATHGIGNGILIWTLHTWSSGRKSEAGTTFFTVDEINVNLQQVNETMNDIHNLRTDMIDVDDLRAESLNARKDAGTIG